MKLVAFLLLVIVTLMTIPAAYAWDMERPGQDLSIYQRTESARTDYNASIGLGVSITRLFKDSDGDDVVGLNVSMTANSRIGICKEGEGGGSHGYNVGSDPNDDGPYLWAGHRGPWIDSNQLDVENATLLSQVGDDFIAPTT
jgi:hypothetical protein